MGLTINNPNLKTLLSIINLKTHLTINKPIGLFAKQRLQSIVGALLMDTFQNNWEVLVYNREVLGYNWEVLVCNLELV